jgi:hypothetical protein
MPSTTARDEVLERVERRVHELGVNIDDQGDLVRQLAKLADGIRELAKRLQVQAEDLMLLIDEERGDEVAGDAV